MHTSRHAVLRDIEVLGLLMSEIGGHDDVPSVPSSSGTQGQTVVDRQQNVHVGVPEVL